RARTPSQARAGCAERMSTPLPGLMQDDFPLTIHHIRRRMRTTRPDAKVVTLREPGVLQRATHAEVAGRIDSLARALMQLGVKPGEDRKSTRLNSSHGSISYAVFCLKKKKCNKKGYHQGCSLMLEASKNDRGRASGITRYLWKQVRDDAGRGSHVMHSRAELAHFHTI